MLSPTLHALYPFLDQFQRLFVLVLLLLLALLLDHALLAGVEGVLPVLGVGVHGEGVLRVEVALLGVVVDVLFGVAPGFEGSLTDPGPMGSSTK